MRHSCEGLASPSRAAHLTSRPPLFGAGAVAPVVHQYDRVLNRSTSMSAVFEAVRHIELQSTSPSRPNRGRGRGAGHRRLGKSRPS